MAVTIPAGSAPEVGDSPAWGVKSRASANPWLVRVARDRSDPANGLKDPGPIALLRKIPGQMMENARWKCKSPMGPHTDCPL